MERRESVLFRQLAPLVRTLIPAAVRADPTQLWRAECLLATVLICLAVIPGYAVLYHYMGDDSVARYCWIASAVIVASVRLFRTAATYPYAKHVIVGTVFVLLLAMSCRLGGLTAPTVIWLSTCPLVAITAGGRAYGIRWTVLAFCGMVAMFCGDLLAIYPPVLVRDLRLLGVISSVT
ncbi:MAG TPA: hypothetical protein VIT92_13315, partial [Burkholderiaceae bacterium]